MFGKNIANFKDENSTSWPDRAKKVQYYKFFFNVLKIS